MTWSAAAAAGLALTLSGGLLALVVTAVWIMDRYDREPLHLVAGAFVWGAVVAMVLATDPVGSLSGLSRDHASWLAQLVRPTIAEVAKSLAVMIVALLSTKFDSPTDGIVYGTATGLGFALVDNALLGSTGFAGEATGASLGSAAARMITITGVHAAGGALVGGCVGLARLVGRVRVRVLWLAIGVASAVLLHAGFLGPTLSQFGSHPYQRWWLIVAFTPYVLCLSVVAAFYRWERQIIYRGLTEEAKLATVPPWVVDVVPFYHRRVRADWWQLMRERTVLSRLLTRLAFRRHAIAALPQSEARLAGLEVVKLRTRIRSILSPPPAQQDL